MGKVKKIRLTKGKFAIVDDTDYEWLSRWSWCLCGGYAGRTYNPNGRKPPHYTIFMHREILGLGFGMTVGDKRQGDHKNRNPLDNRRSNLRVATPSQNQHNRSKNMKNKSGFKGVSWSDSNNGWIAQIKLNRKAIHLGTFPDPPSAYVAYCAAALRYHGEFSRV